MAKIKPMALIETMKGKVCMHSDVYFRVNKRNGQVSTGKMCNPYEGEPSTAQTAVRAAFSTAVQSAKAILAAKATDEDQSNYTKLQTYTAAYNADSKFGGTLYSFIVKKEFVNPNAD